MRTTKPAAFAAAALMFRLLCPAARQWAWTQESAWSRARPVDAVSGTFALEDTPMHGMTADEALSYLQESRDEIIGKVLRGQHKPYR